MNRKVFIGVDGCSAGWFAVLLAVEGEKSCDWEVELFAESMYPKSLGPISRG